MGLGPVDHQGCGDELPGSPPAHLPRLEHLERHGHTWHESRDVLVFDRELLTGGIDGDNLSVQLVVPRRALAPRRAGRQRDNSGDGRDDDEQSPWFPAGIHLLTLQAGGRRSNGMHPA